MWNTQSRKRRSKPRSRRNNRCLAQPSPSGPTAWSASNESQAAHLAGSFLGAPHFQTVQPCGERTMSIRSNHDLRRWLAKEVLGTNLPRKPPKRESVLHPNQPARSVQYRAWIRSLPCAVCGTSFGVEAAHTGPHGVQQKASDYSCIPLCHPHHRTGNDALDKIGHLAFEQRFGLEIAAIIETLQIQSADIKVGSRCKISSIEVGRRRGQALHLGLSGTAEKGPLCRSA